MISGSRLGPPCLQNHIRKLCWEQTAPTKRVHGICSVTVCSHLLSSRCQNVPPHAFSSRALEVQCLLFVLSSFFFLFFFHPQVAAARCTMCVSANTARTRNMQFGKSQDTTEEEGEKRREEEGEKERVWKKKEKKACDRKVQAKEWVRGGRSCQQTREGVKKGEIERERETEIPLLEVEESPLYLFIFAQSRDVSK